MLSRTLRARDNGAADYDPLVARRFAPHNHADQPDIARPKLRFVRARRLSAAPLETCRQQERYIISKVKCLLCEKDKVLCYSHIVPEFLYKPLYNSDRQIMAISGQGNKGWKPLKKGVREHLLCADCERHINDNYEKPFLEQWETMSPLPLKIHLDQLYSAKYDYTSFKLFHLSILFRASVSSLPSFRSANIGQRHERRIRVMLLGKDPGRQAEYPIMGFVVVNKDGERERRFISVPFPSRYQDHRIYGQVYGGVVWWISISSHRNKDFIRTGLQDNGDMAFLPEKLDDLLQAKVAGMLLRKEHF